jgi:hypothetical protein
MTVEERLDEEQVKPVPYKSLEEAKRGPSSFSIPAVAPEFPSLSSFGKVLMLSIDDASMAFRKAWCRRCRQDISPNWDRLSASEHHPKPFAPSSFPPLPKLKLDRSFVRQGSNFPVAIQLHYSTQLF